jgi:hypothetical protein
VSSRTVAWLRLAGQLSRFLGPTSSSLSANHTEYGKAIGVGLNEFRIRWTAAEISHKVSGLPAASVP